MLEKLKNKRGRVNLFVGNISRFNMDANWIAYGIFSCGVAFLATQIFMKTKMKNLQVNKKRYCFIENSLALKSPISQRIISNENATL